MEASSTIKKMLAGNKVVVPTYQRAYSWDTEAKKENSTKQVNVFLRDLEQYNTSSAKTPYYFGHFLFEEKTKEDFAVIDGQQRLTTLVIFLSALFTRLKAIRPLTDPEIEAKEDMVKRNSTYRFETVDYDRQLFKDYVIDQEQKDSSGLSTTSAKRIVAAFDFFTNVLADKDESYLVKMLETVSAATCTTHPVRDESEAIQMFIFQNNRGKKPSNLEIIKAQFMFAVHLQGGEAKDNLIAEIKARFENIYKSISAIEGTMKEDDVLGYTLQVYFNSLSESNALERINKKLAVADPVPFIKSFSLALDASFRHLTTFFRNHEPQHHEIHSLVTLGGFSLAIPFIIKAYTFALPIQDICQLCTALESVVLRSRVIGTRADLTSRLNDKYSAFTTENPSIEPIVKRVNYLKTTIEWWYAYWNKTELEKALQGWLHPSTARFLLWKHENHLQGKGKNGYALSRFDAVTRPELEHIAPQTPTKGEPVAAGYPAYDEDFRNQYIDCLGNYLLLSKSHNCSVGNRPFLEKRASYTHTAQQREIQDLSAETNTWTKQMIIDRKAGIIEFITEYL
ncbi:DUF262 domain-containing protein [Hymenobacter monticola]|uniref:DUF262 domain-containing HNH endonuclease family protein n=1 Tax=Hymenobacter monticola TaxID=1705399 RepID=A0ABY4BEQ6_9BACT|nr:DUF262 domain-containing protein [Hymenobacter monticola]UOE36752.1 DUF262 domain-containing HNH endonuclease family protein [Hymenobacter monticola]